eukprot:1131533-Amorphochlora_amoeboformis.AAC.1
MLELPLRVLGLAKLDEDLYLGLGVGVAVGLGCAWWLVVFFMVLVENEGGVAYAGPLGVLVGAPNCFLVSKALCSRLAVFECSPTPSTARTLPVASILANAFDMVSSSPATARKLSGFALVSGSGWES